MPTGTFRGIRKVGNWLMPRSLSRKRLSLSRKWLCWEFFSKTIIVCFYIMYLKAGASLHHTHTPILRFCWIVFLTNWNTWKSSQPFLWSLLKVIYHVTGFWKAHQSSWSPLEVLQPCFLCCKLYLLHWNYLPRTFGTMVLRYCQTTILLLAKCSAPVGVGRSLYACYNCFGCCSGLFESCLYKYSILNYLV